ncbi:hypothetical protein BpHYR1_028074 [Brachionus plicatilis]|uniref:Uncharacterized protein n=1 Tax=Brachionus plicatilis TaxID=10195 RepID=A0A3M7R2Z1_BRAPC|nr:hypothetical protein BpHYR1_028074 [Brachionus plicatilis]
MFVFVTHIVSTSRVFQLPAVRCIALNNCVSSVAQLLYDKFLCYLPDCLDRPKQAFDPHLRMSPDRVRVEFCEVE